MTFSQSTEAASEPVRGADSDCMPVHDAAGERDGIADACRAHADALFQLQDAYPPGSGQHLYVLLGASGYRQAANDAEAGLPVWLPDFDESRPGPVLRADPKRRLENLLHEAADVGLEDL